MNGGRIAIIVMMLAMGLMMALPNIGPLYHFYSADRAEKTTASWTTSRVISNAKDTVGLPTYSFTRKIGPMPQDCSVELMQYVHAPEGHPKFRTMTVIAGETCNDVVVLDDPPRERLILALFGLAFVLAALFMLYSQRKRS